MKIDQKTDDPEADASQSGLGAALTINEQYYYEAKTKEQQFCTDSHKPP